ncbi:MAG: hypothetical protein VX438_09710 [Planctomycetota bacterium]|nr:hypothetical protein [Planctomycetota bacterium]
MSGFFFDYSDLDVLCADRDLVTPEVHATNDFYGQASVLKRYTGLPSDYSLKAVIEHGITLADQMWDHDRDSSLPWIFSSSQWRADIHRKLSKKKSIPVGFGYLYARDLVESMAGPIKKREGTIAFPCHSTHTIRANFDHEDYANRLSELPAFMHPVSVCLYWKNYLLGEHLPYRKKGFQVVSAGHMFDQDFMLRFCDLCRHHQFSTSNETGSHLFLSTSSGCRFVFTDSKQIDWQIPNNEVKNCAKTNVLFQERRRQARLLFGNGIVSKSQSGISNEQREFVDALTGADCQLNAVELRKQIKQAETAYQFVKFKSWTQRRWSKITRLGKSVGSRWPWEKAS